jgi:hypothetical protein
MFADKWNKHKNERQPLHELKCNRYGITNLGNKRQPVD